MPDNIPAGFRLVLMLVCGLPALPATPQSRPVFPAKTEVALPVPVAQPVPVESAPRPLPDIPTLMHQVEQHQQLAEAVQKDYTYRSAMRLERLGKQGNVKDVESRVTDVFYLDGIPVERTLEHNGKPLTPEAQKKEDDHIDREVAKAKERLAKASSSGKETDSSGHSVVTVSRLLQLGTFTNPRRIQVDGRDTIVVDFTGDPNAKTNNPSETVLHDMAGTIWVDEQDRTIQHLQGTFVNTFKIGGGLVADISKGTSFAASNVRINNEVWLPANVEAHGHIRFLLFFNVNGNLTLHNSDYRKFKVTSTILAAGSSSVPPGAAASPDAQAPSSAPK